MDGRMDRWVFWIIYTYVQRLYTYIDVQVYGWMDVCMVLEKREEEEGD